MKRANLLFAPLLLFPLLSGVIAPAYAATSPVLGSSATYGLLASTYVNPVPGTTINGDVGFTLPAPAVNPAGTHTNYGSSAPYAAAGADQASALSTLNAQLPCTYTFPAVPNLDLATDVSHGPLGIYTPGIYCNSTLSSFTRIGAAGITLSGSGTYIFRMKNILSTDRFSKVDLKNGASACDVWWTPSPGPVLPEFGMDSSFAGTYIYPADIKLLNNVTWAGRLLAFGGRVETSIDDTITVPTCQTRTPHLLTVVKTVVNSHGGTSAASDFNIHVTLAGVDVVGSPAVGLASPGRDYSLPDNTYAVSENMHAGYTATFSGDCDSNGVVIVGLAPKTCTITNTDNLTSKTCITSGGPMSPGGVKVTCTTSITTPTPTPTPTPTDTTSPTPSPSPSGSPSPTPSPSPSGSRTPTPSPSPSGSPSPSATPTLPGTRGLPGTLSKPGPGIGIGFIPVFPHTGFESVVRSSASGTQVGIPMHLLIPSIKVNAVVEQVGLTSSKAVEVPKGHGQVAWYKIGARPGNEGTAVIDGHFARKTSGWAVFNDLYKLRQGDIVSIKDSKGKVIRFVVQSRHIYDVDARPSEVYFSTSGAHLNLVTCAGVWINALNGFDKRLVVFTDLVN